MSHKPTERLTILYLRGVKRDIKDRFKAWCAKRGLTMIGGFEKIVREVINQDEKLKDLIK
jgi:hypothetical protein